MKKYGFIFIFSLLTIRFLAADWSPAFLQRDTNDLTRREYLQLRENTIASLANSWCSPEKAILLMDLVLLEKPQVCVEIGAFLGSTVIPVATALKYNGSGKIFAIDAWSNQEAIKGFAIRDPNAEWWEGLNMNYVQSQFTKDIKQRKLESYCAVLNGPSRTVVKNIPAIDFLHIDGNYSREGSCEDVDLYLPKVKIGGYILYTNLHWIVDGKTTRMKAFSKLLDSCEIVAFVDDRSTYLLRKIIN